MTDKYKNKYLIFTLVNICILVVSCATTAIGGDKNYPAEGNVKVLSNAAEKDLTFSDKPLRVVFAIDASGKIQGFRTSKERSFPITKPFHAGDVEKIEMITLIKTSNPKWCYKTTSGDQDCIEW